MTEDGGLGREVSHIDEHSGVEVDIWESSYVVSQGDFFVTAWDEVAVGVRGETGGCLGLVVDDTGYYLFHSVYYWWFFIWVDIASH